jgi:uncharacterized phage-associated protein
MMETVPVLNEVLLKAYSKMQDDDLTPTRVQKLLYFLHGWYTTITGIPLLDEAFVHYTYGPVLLSLETKLSRYAGIPVDDYVRQFNLDTGTMEPVFTDEKAAPQFIDILDAVWKQYSPLTTIQLSSLSHAPGSPWDKTAMGQPIPTSLIVEDFMRRASGK